MGRSENDLNRKLKLEEHLWKVVRFLRKGGFGVVHEAETYDGVSFAVKEISLTALGKESFHELEKEITFLSQLKHVNIVEYYGSFLVETKLYIFLELAPKGSLLDLYKKHKLLEPQVSKYTRQILNGLSYLHGKHVIHRDIKCANILVYANDIVKLADFGLAKHSPSNDCNSDKGTAFWKAPEVVNKVHRKDGGYGLEADIWSLGCTVLEMLTQQHPYPQCEQNAALFKIFNGELPSVPDSLSKEARDFILKCLKVNPSERPTAHQLLGHPFVESPLHTSIGPAHGANGIQPERAFI